MRVRRGTGCRNGRNPFWRVLWTWSSFPRASSWERISADVRDHTVELSVFWRVIGLSAEYSPPFPPSSPVPVPCSRSAELARASARPLAYASAPARCSPFSPSSAVFRGTSKGNLLRNPRPRRLWERKHEIAIPRTPCSEAFIDNQIPILSSFISTSVPPSFSIRPPRDPSSFASSSSGIRGEPHPLCLAWGSIVVYSKLLRFTRRTRDYWSLPIPDLSKERSSKERLN